MTSAAPSPLILAVDVGSTTIKAARFRADGVQLGGPAEHRHRNGVAATLDPDRLLKAVLAVLNGLDLQNVHTVAFTTVWQTSLLIDSEGNVSGEPTTWETPQTAPVIGRLTGTLGRSWDQHATGAYLHSSYPLLAAAVDPALGSADRLQDIGSWVIERLTGTPVGWSEPIASGSGLWDQRQRRWSDSVDELGVRGHLERRPLFAAAVTPIRPHASLPTELRSALWMPPLPDGLCHNLGVGAVDAVVAITVGTSGSVRAVTDEPPDGPLNGLWNYRCGPEMHAFGGAISTAGNLLEWVQQLTGRPLAWSWAYKKTPRLPTIHAMPDVYGRRGPDYPHDATGALVGVRPHHTLTDIADAFTIDMWSNFRTLHNLLSYAHPISEVRAGGGVIERFPQSAQILADALGTPVVISSASQPALRGAALVAGARLTPHRDHNDPIAQAVGAIRTQATESPAIIRSVEPRSAWTDALTARWASSTRHEDQSSAHHFSTTEGNT